MATNKDFSGINTGRVYNNIERATNNKRLQDAPSAQEIQERQSAMKTQGRKGCKAQRINMAFSTENYEFIRIVSRIKGMSMTQYLNAMIDQYRAEHPEVYDEAKALIDKFNL